MFQFSTIFDLVPLADLRGRCRPSQLGGGGGGRGWWGCWGGGWILPPCAEHMTVVGVRLELVVPFGRPIAKTLAASFE